MTHPDPASQTHEHHEGKEVHAHRPQSALEAEIVTHLPLSVAGAAIGLALAGVICFMSQGIADQGHRGGQTTAIASVDDAPAPHADPTEGSHGHEHHDAEAIDPHVAHASDAGGAQAADDGHDHAHEGAFRPLFHLFHPLHMLFSAAATTAMFWRYDKRLLRAVIVGLIGAIGVCGLSDILIPHVALVLLDQPYPLHICVLEHPDLVFPFAAVGIVIGLLAAAGVSRSTFFSHALHVFISTMASIFYIVSAYEPLAWLDKLGWIFLFIIIAVVGPCCLSDIVFPVAMTKSAREQHAASVCCH